jgi:hypothetical protein
MQLGFVLYVIVRRLLYSWEWVCSYNSSIVAVCVGLARTLYIRCTYGIFGRETTKHTVMYGVYIWFWPTLSVLYRQKRACRFSCLVVG